MKRWGRKPVFFLGGAGHLHFLCGLTLLGLGWNCLFVSSTSLLTTTYSQGEGAKVQATHGIALAILGLAGVSCALLRLRAGGPRAGQSSLIQKADTAPRIPAASPTRWKSRQWAGKSSR